MRNLISGPRQIEDLQAAEGADAAFIFGDFNEPSFRDWTGAIDEAGFVGEKAPEADIVVTPWPSDHRATVAKVSF